MKIACDTNVSNKTIKFLQQKGFEVVFKAGSGQPDKEWFFQALFVGADVFVSGDSDLALLVEQQYNQKLRWVNFPNLPYKDGHANAYLLNRLTAIKEVWKF